MKYVMQISSAHLFIALPCSCSVSCLLLAYAVANTACVELWPCDNIGRMSGIDDGSSQPLK
jgi:hypothetical protein